MKKDFLYILLIFVVTLIAFVLKSVIGFLIGIGGLLLFIREMFGRVYTGLV